MTTSGELPPVVARLWGRTASSRKGPRPSLTAGSVVGAAVEIADAEGLAAVTMSSVAHRLGVAPMSLYRYVGSKDDLVVMMTDAVSPEPPENDGHGWRHYLAAWTRANRDFLVDRPWLLDVAGTTPPVGPRALRWLDRALAAMEETGLGSGERVIIASTLGGFAASQARLRVGLGSRPTTAAAGAADTEHTAEVPNPAAGRPDGLPDYGRLLAAVLDPVGYPALSRAVQAGVFDHGEEWIDDDDFVLGLDLLLDGIEALVARRRR